MNNAPSPLESALRHHQAGEFEEAEKLYRRVLKSEPKHPDALHLLGVVSHQVGRHDKAVKYIQRAIESRPMATFHSNLGLAYHALGKFDQAIDSYRRACKLSPNMAEVQNNLSNALREKNRLEEAEACYRQAVELKPDYAEAHNNLGNALKNQDRLDEAVNSYQRALKIKPDYPHALGNLANAHKAGGRVDEAIACYRRSLQLDPKQAETHNDLGAALYGKKAIDEAIACYRRALALEPDYIDALDNIAEALKNNGQTSEAREYLERALAIQPAARRRVLLATLLPVIYRSADDVARYRQRLIDRLGSLIEDGVQFDPAGEYVSPLFFLAYQGMDDRPIQEMITQLHTAGQDAPQPPRPKPSTDAGQKTRVGFLSVHFKNHTIGKLTGGLVAQLSREKFTVVVLSLGDHDDADARWIQQQADEYMVVPKDLEIARQTVLDAGLDLLVYPDVGMDAQTSSLARARLAPVQCAMWGHPVTTGIPTIDHFISSKLLEPPQGRDHYTERLVELDNLPAYYYRPEFSSAGKTRADFGLDDRRHLYFCPQSLFKFHPHFDLPMGEILRRDPDGELVLIEGMFPHWNQLLMDRLRTTIPDVVDRVRFVPRQEREDFVNLFRLCDVVLDPFHFGGGNTTYEAFAAGTPIVSLPSGYMRGRVTLGCYKKMDILDCIAADADEYVEIAVRLGTDPQYREQIRRKILSASDALFENRDAVIELEEFFTRAVRLDDQPTPTSESATVVGSRMGCQPRFSSFRDKNELADVLQSSTCPACGHHVAVPFYDGGRRPLATLAWPESSPAARSMPRHPLSFVRCIDCGHVYNSRFDYSVVPYSDKPNLMFNRGVLWTAHLDKVRRLILDHLPPRPSVVEIGCGDGDFLKSLALARPEGRFVGFDPAASAELSDGQIDVRRSLFQPGRHLEELLPDLVISRHVLEHLMNPLAFVQAVSFATSWLNTDTRLFIEVPCVDKALRLGRTVDFFYEHNSNFTTDSLERMLQRCAGEVELVQRGYNDEVAYGMAQFKSSPKQVALAQDALAFRRRATESQSTVRQALESLVQQGERIAIWGGTGKAAAFITQYGLDARRFPTVVDSDLDKAGTFVPDMGQKIRFRDHLLDHPVEIILIATQWRAADIVTEIEHSGITFDQILIEHEGRLVDYVKDEHPYR